MIIETILDMRAFVGLLLFFLLTMSVIQHMLNLMDPVDEENENDSNSALYPIANLWNNFKMMYSFMLGEVIGTSDPIIRWIFFLILTLMVNIVVLNLLIAIISNTFDRVQSNQKAVDCKELAQMMLEVEQMMIWRRGYGTFEYLCILNYDQMDAEEDEWEGKMRTIFEKFDKLDKNSNEVKAMTKQLQEKLENLEKNNKVVVEKVDKLDIQKLEKKFEEIANENAQNFEKKFEENAKENAKNLKKEFDDKLENLNEEMKDVKQSLLNFDGKFAQIITLLEKK